MHKKPVIITALILFLALVTYPFWSQLGRSMALPEPVLPTDQKECVESRAYMRSHHMQMLHEWRDEVVREGKHIYVNQKGQKFVKSLSNTCMKCHTDEKAFCEQCHQAVGVKLYCFRCHNLQPDLEHTADPTTAAESFYTHGASSAQSAAGAPAHRGGAHQ